MGFARLRVLPMLSFLRQLATGNGSSRIPPREPGHGDGRANTNRAVIGVGGSSTETRAPAAGRQCFARGFIGSASASKVVT